MIIAKEAGGTKGLLPEATHNTKFYHQYYAFERRNRNKI
jgi:hypothetical protein